jgi:hypothetical protein
MAREVLPGWVKYLADSRAAYRIREQGTYADVVEFTSESECVGFFAASSDGRYKFLIQQQYLDIWKLCEEKLSSHDLCNRQLIILGTAGIGKSAGRLLYILMWLEREMTHDFKFIVFNLGEVFYVVHPNGNVFRTSPVDSRWSESLLLLDPCSFLASAQVVDCRMLLVFTSPSPLVGQAKMHSLSGVEKVSNMYVMSAPNVDDLAKLHDAIDEKQLKLLSWVRDGTRYCSLRWFTYDETEQRKRIKAALNYTTKEGLWNWFMTNTKEKFWDPRLPLRLCVIEPSETEQWLLSGFISDEIERYAFDWAMGHGQHKVTELVSLLNNRALKDGLGIYFERWLFEMLGNGTSLYISAERRGFSFSGLQNIQSDEFEMEQGIVYKLERAKFSTIEGYALIKDTLLLLQSTVSETHLAARHNDVKGLIRKAKRVVKLKELLIVFIVPSHQAFTPPSCKGFPAITSVVWGVVDDDELLQVIKNYSAGHGDKKRRRHGS